VFQPLFEAREKEACALTSALRLAFITSVLSTSNQEMPAQTGIKRIFASRW
jgi:hypothetical protein